MRLNSHYLKSKIYFMKVVTFYAFFLHLKNLQKNEMILSLFLITNALDFINPIKSKGAITKYTTTIIHS